jgi:hypothetical protein
MPKNLPELLALYEAGKIDEILPEKYSGATEGEWIWDEDHGGLGIYDAEGNWFYQGQIITNDSGVYGPYGKDIEIICDAKRLAAENALLLAAVRSQYESLKGIRKRLHDRQVCYVDETDLAEVKDIFNESLKSIKPLLKLMGGENE